MVANARKLLGRDFAVMKMAMKTGFWKRLETARQNPMPRKVAGWLDRVIALLRIPAPGTPQVLQRITVMERDLVLPLKTAGIAMLLYSFFFSSSSWMNNVLGELEIAVESTQYIFGIYIIINIAFAVLLLNIQKVSPLVTEWAVLIISLVDGIFVATLTLVTGGPDSVLYWIFLALIVRGAVSVPRATSQLMLNLTLCAYFAIACVINIAIVETMDEGARNLMELSERPFELLLLRVLLLLLMTACCYAIQVLLTRQRLAEEELREFAVREAQLQSAGRLAAEFAHQLKNPLAIINNAAYSLKKSLVENKPAVEQIRIIEEEVEHSDRIITQVMGYAQLSEGRVEKLDLIEELDRAIAQVFPPAVDSKVEVHRDYDHKFPPLLMQRRHLSESLLNLLQNSREAFNGACGNVSVSARCLSDYSTEITIGDDGPGIPPDKRERVFEPYYTTKKKGTGLGLATVKHNVELYGGSVRLESELGKGAQFTIIFPARTLMRLDKKPQL
jgi:signal transduction histidine kinase